MPYPLRDTQTVLISKTRMFICKNVAKPGICYFVILKH